MEPTSRITQLPSELIHQICSNLGPRDLARLARTCRALTSHAYNDTLWKGILREKIPERFMPSNSDVSEDQKTYREIYANHHPYWFLPQNKLWFSDEKPRGELVLCKYNLDNNRIVGYTVTAVYTRTPRIPWSFHPRVMITKINFDVELFGWESVFSLPGHGLKPPRPKDSSDNVEKAWWADGIKMQDLYKHVEDDYIMFLQNMRKKELQEPWSEQEEVWPPQTIPNMPRVRPGYPSEHPYSRYASCFADISQTAFGVHDKRGNSRSTWSTLDPSLYTPTKEKPYQGIYVADYSPHGCEFILVMHIDNPPYIPPSRPDALWHSNAMMAEQMYLDAENDASNGRAQLQGQPAIADEACHTGALVGVKLTGDPNVRRGEYTFIASDISRSGTIRIAQEEPFTGARIVKSHGHVAEHLFTNDDYLKTRLILRDSNRLAHCWMGWNHISFYERIDIDALLDTAP